MLHYGPNPISVTQSLSFLVLSPIQGKCIWNKPNGFFGGNFRYLSKTSALHLAVPGSPVADCGDMLILIGLAVQTLGDLLPAMF